MCPSWPRPGGVDREPGFPSRLEHSVWEEQLEFPWSPLVGERGRLDVAWAPRTLFMVHGRFEAELGPIMEFVVKK